jgi:hypothetical protein
MKRFSLRTLLAMPVLVGLLFWWRMAPPPPALWFEPTLYPVPAEHDPGFRARHPQLEIRTELITYPPGQFLIGPDSESWAFDPTAVWHGDSGTFLAMVDDALACCVQRRTNCRLHIKRRDVQRTEAVTRIELQGVWQCYSCTSGDVYYRLDAFWIELEHATGAMTWGRLKKAS